MKPTESSLEQAAARLLLATLATSHASDSFGEWLKAATPEWSWDFPYQRYIRSYLARVTSGELRRLMIFVPPRHGKSELVTVRYPLFRLERDPSFRTIIAAYNQTLADKFNRKARRIASKRHRITIDPEHRAVNDWETVQGGGIRSVGVGGGITGMGANLIIIDDPVKSRDEANSLTIRDRTYEWYTDDLYSRLEPGGAIVLIMTRWHEDDLAGRILANESGWEVIKLPAIAEDDDPLGRAPGEPLNPTRFPLSELLKIKEVQGRSFYALYQQEPHEQEGDLFKRSSFKFVDAVPRDAKRLRYWDRGATAGGGDYTVGTLLAYADGRIYVEDVVRGQWSTNERDRIIEDTADADADAYAYGAVPQWFEQEPGSSGVDVIRGFQRRLAGYAVWGDRVTGSKETRAEPFAAQVEAGNVYVKRAAWNHAWIEELCAFPTGKHDDQVDSVSGAFNRLLERSARKEARSILWVN